MTRNLTLGNWELDTDSTDGERIRFVHIVTGEVITFSEDGGLIPDHYPAADLPTTPVSAGELFYDSTRDVPVWWDGSAYEWPTFVDDVITEDVTVANTATQTVAWTFDVDVGSFVAGRVYQLDISGRFSTANTSDTFDVVVTVGGSEMARETSEPANVTDAPWNLECTAVVRETGESGVIVAHSAGLFNAQPDDDDHGETVIDTTTATTFTVEFEWAQADPANSVTLGQGHLKQMG